MTGPPEVRMSAKHLQQMKIRVWILPEQIPLCAGNFSPLHSYVVMLY